MKNYRCRILLCAATLSCLPVISSAGTLQATEYPDLVYEGRTLLNACNSSPQIVLKARADALKIGDTETFLSVANMILCGDNNPENRARLASLVGKEIGDATALEGEVRRRTIPVDEHYVKGLFAERQAWAAKITENGGAVYLTYSNEACTRILTFRYLSANWQLVEHTKGCD